jgi:hypothetical protein
MPCTEVIAMLDLETNKAIALRLVEVFNGAYANAKSKGAL